MKFGTGIKLISKSKTITSSYDVTNLTVGFTVRSKTTVTNDPKEVMSLIDPSSVEEVIGLEVQYFRHSNNPAILTLSGFDAGVNVDCLIIQLIPNFVDKIPDQLRNLLSDKRRKFVGANVGRSVAMLKEHYGINVDRYEDIFDIAGGRSFKESLSRPLAMILSVLTLKLMILRNTPEIEGAVWEKEELDNDLVAYATLESYVSYFVGLVTSLESN